MLERSTICYVTEMVFLTLLVWRRPAMRQKEASLILKHKYYNKKKKEDEIPAPTHPTNSFILFCLLRSCCGR